MELSTQIGKQLGGFSAHHGQEQDIQSLADTVCFFCFFLNYRNCFHIQIFSPRRSLSTAKQSAGVLLVLYLFW